MLSSAKTRAAAALLPLVPVAERLVERPWVRRAVGWLTRVAGVAGMPWPEPDVTAGDQHPDGVHADGPDVFVWRAPAGAAPAAGPLAGWTFVVKDNFDVAGVAWTEGTALARPTPVADCTIVERLRAAGATLVGKAKMTELGLSGLGLLTHGGTPDNPAAPGHFAGGSSTGPAVAVARGEARFAIGSDALGSVRIPAAFTGLYGLKPTHGTLDTRGYHSLVPALDMPGPLARTLGDLRAVHAALAPEIAARPAAVTGRVLVSKVALPAAPELTRAVMRAAHHLELVPGPRPDFRRAMGAALLTGTAALRDLACPPRAALETRVVLGLARCMDARVAAQAAAERAALRAAFLAALERARADALLVPTTAIAPPARTRARMASRPEPGLHAALGAFTTLANTTGCPALAVPIGRDARGRPLSAMLVGRPGAEATLFALAERLVQTPA